jgi:hypothetical protein
MRDTARVMFESASRFAVDDGYVCPALVVIDRDCQCSLAGIGVAAQNRDLLREMLALLAADPDVFGVIIVSEAMARKGKVELAGEGTPDLRCAFVVAAQWRGGRVCFGRYFSRDDGGAVVLEEEFGDGEWSGPLFESWEGRGDE